VALKQQSSFSDSGGQTAARWPENHRCVARIVLYVARGAGLRRKWGNLQMRWGQMGPLLLAVGILGAFPAFAAQVRVVPDEKSAKGAVMLNHGQGYAPISGPTVANTGDSVIAFAGGHATVIYPDGCTVDVNDRGTVVRVSETSPCKGPAGLLPSGGFSGGKYVVGAVIGAGAIAAAAVSLSGGDGGGGGGNNGGNDDKPRPRSP
jgi:hypothetical protein